MLKSVILKAGKTSSRLLKSTSYDVRERKNNENIHSFPLFYSPESHFKL